MAVETGAAAKGEMDIQAGFFQIRVRRFSSIQPATCGDAETWTQSRLRSRIFTSRPGLILNSSVLLFARTAAQNGVLLADHRNGRLPLAGHAVVMIGAQGQAQEQGKCQAVDDLFVSAFFQQQEQENIQQQDGGQQEQAQCVQAQLGFQNLDGP